MPVNSRLGFSVQVLGLTSSCYRMSLRILTVFCLCFSLFWAFSETLSGNVCGVGGVHVGGVHVGGVHVGGVHVGGVHVGDAAELKAKVLRLSSL